VSANAKYEHADDGAGKIMIDIQEFIPLFVAGAVFFIALIIYNTRGTKERPVAHAAPAVSEKPIEKVKAPAPEPSGPLWSNKDHSCRGSLASVSNGWKLDDEE